MGQCEGADHFDKIPQVHYRQDQRADKEQVIVAGEDVRDAMVHKRRGHPCLVEPWWTRGPAPLTIEPEWRFGSQEQALDRWLPCLPDAHEVVRLPRIARRKLKLAQHILLHIDA